MRCNWRKGVSILSLIVAILLSDLMCAAVAFNYVDIVWGIKYAGYQMLPETAFRLLIPFGIGILIFLAIFMLFWHRGKQYEEKLAKELRENPIPRKRMGKRAALPEKEQEKPGKKR